MRPDELSTKNTSIEKVPVQLIITYNLKPQYGGLLLTLLKIVSSVAYCFTVCAWELAHVQCDLYH